MFLHILKIALIIAVVIALVIVLFHLLPWLLGGAVVVLVVQRWLTRNRPPGPPQWPWIR